MLPPSALSAEMVAATEPSAEAARAAMGARCARYCLTNLCTRSERKWYIAGTALGVTLVTYSIPDSPLEGSRFFQNLRNPSTEEVKMKSVLSRANNRQSAGFFGDTHRGRKRHSLGHNDVRERVTMHKAPPVAVGRRQMVQIERLVLEH
jgi:hypothetical protein